MEKSISTPAPQQPFYWLIPSAIDLPHILKEHPPAFSYKIDYFYYLIHIICDMMNYLNPSDDTKWVHLNATKLQKFNQNYKRYLEYLDEQDIIIINPSYQTDKVSKGYRITDIYYSGIPVEIGINEDDCIIKKKVEGLKQAKTKQLQQADMTHPYLTKHMNSKLIIDKEGALQEIDKLYPKDNKQYFYKGKWRSIRRARMKALRAVAKLAKQDFTLKVDKNIGRCHTNLTCLKKDLRKYLKYFGKPLVNLDIRNSQSLFSGMLLNKAFYEPGGNFSIFSISSLHYLLNPDSLHSIISSVYFIMLGVSAQKEFKQYLEIVQGGRFYEEMSELMYPGQPFDRALMKETIYIMFFADNRHGPELRKLEAPFRAKFPNVYEVFKLLKKHNKRVLSHILQRIESLLMIETVAKRIGREHPYMPIFPIHDSIATTEEHADYVESVIKDEIKKLTGLDACIGREMWS